MDKPSKQSGPQNVALMHNAVEDVSKHKSNLAILITPKTFSPGQIKNTYAPNLEIKQ